MDNEKNKDVVKTLNKLIEINNDRIEGYETAAKETDDTELKALFLQNANQSRTFKGELETVVRENGGEIETGTSLSGKVYRGFMDVKAGITGKDRKAIVSSCEFGEDNAKNAYEAAIKDTVSFPSNVTTLITRQSNEIVRAHDRIRELRDTMV